MIKAIAVSQRSCTGATEARELSAAETSFLCEPSCGGNVSGS